MKARKITVLPLLLICLLSFSCTDKYAQVHIKNGNSNSDIVISNIKIFSDSNILISEKTPQITKGNYETITIDPANIYVEIQVRDKNNINEVLKTVSSETYTVLEGEDLYLWYTGNVLGKRNSI